MEEAADGAAPRTATGALIMPPWAPALLRASTPLKQVATPAPCARDSREVVQLRDVRACAQGVLCEMRVWHATHVRDGCCYGQGVAGD